MLHRCPLNEDFEIHSIYSSIQSIGQAQLYFEDTAVSKMGKSLWLHRADFFGEGQKSINKVSKPVSKVWSMSAE